MKKFILFVLASMMLSGCAGNRNTEYPNVEIRADDPSLSDMSQHVQTVDLDTDHDGKVDVIRGGWNSGDVIFNSVTAGSFAPSGANGTWVALIPNNTDAEPSPVSGKNGIYGFNNLVKLYLNGGTAYSLLTAGNIGSSVQAYDTDLAYLASFTPTANVKTILNAADYTAIRTALGLTIGTNLQAYDANMIAWPAAVSNAEVGYLDGVTSSIQTQINGKQATLVSGTNIKTVNGASLVGSGDVTISGSGGGVSFYSADPANPSDNSFWINTSDLTLNFSDASGINKSVPFSHTAWDTTPATFSFTDLTNTSLSTQYTALAQITGINRAITFTSTGGTVAACTGSTVDTCGTFGTTSGQIANSQYVAARLTSSASNSTAVNNVVSSGGVSDTFTVTTVAGGGGGGTVLSDPLTESTELALSSHVPTIGGSWTTSSAEVVANTTGATLINGATAVGRAFNGVTDVPNGSFTARIKVGIASNVYYGAVGRLTDINNGVVALLSGDGLFRLRDRTNNVSQVIGTNATGCGTFDASATYTIKMTAVGNQVVAYWYDTDGITEKCHTPGTGATTSAYGTGKPGILTSDKAVKILDVAAVSN